MKAPHGGPAFPVIYPDNSGKHFATWTGMNLRDWFAGQALAGHLARASIGFRSEETVAKDMYKIADAMLAARGNDDHS